MDEHTEMLIEQTLHAWRNFQFEFEQHIQRQTEAQERIATNHALLAERIKVVSWLAALVLGVLLGVAFALLLQALGFVTLFEDGSIQFFNHAGWGFCLFPNGGCS